MRINQFVASASDLSRRAADAAIEAGRVNLDGQVARLGMTVSDDGIVELDGQRLTLPTEHIYLILNKPVGYICSRARQGQAPTIYDLLPHQYQTCNPIGRLDKDSSGLLLLTTDGTFANRAAHPSFGKQKHYEITLDRTPTDDDLARLDRGVTLEDGPSLVHVVARDNSRLTVTLTEGRNRQLRRTFAALGYKVRRLHRTMFGPYRLGGLKSGAWQAFDPAVLA